MTIDIGFASLVLPSGVVAGIVDVPGHERFVKNMLAGAGGVDVALLVVAADDGPMPQTREHVDILTVLGVSSGVVALTRCDLADPETIAVATAETEALLAATPLAGCSVVPVSAVSGEGIPALIAALDQAVARTRPRDVAAPFRLPIDRAFTLPGTGTVVTGTLVCGTLATGDAVEIQPLGKMSKARTLHRHGQRTERAVAGSRVAVNLPGVDVDDVERGAVLCAPGSVAATRTVDVQLDLLASTPRPLRHRDRVRLHVGTGEVPARVHLLGTDKLEPGTNRAAAQLLCEADIAPTRGERFVVRSWSPSRAIGGGVVVDPNPARRWRRSDSDAKAQLEARTSVDHSEAVLAALAARTQDFSEAELIAATGLDVDSLNATLQTLETSGRAVRLRDGHWLGERNLQRVRETAVRITGDHHRKFALQRAMPRDGLRVPLSKAAAVHDFVGLVEWLVDSGVLVAEPGAKVRLPEHAVVLRPDWRKAADEIAAVYDAAGFNPPYPNAFVFPKDVPVPALLAVLADEGRLAKIGDNLWISAGAYRQALDALSRLSKSPDGITVASMRDATGSSRKIILPLLEHFDSQRITRRVGENQRTLVALPGIGEG
jgi:selenocysteine-specific elongation factor